MNLIYQDNCENIPWEKVPSLLRRVGMGFADADTHRISFEASYSVIFVFDDVELIGFGRAISDGVRQSAIYDVAVEPAFQGKRIYGEDKPTCQKCPVHCYNAEMRERIKVVMRFSGPRLLLHSPLLSISHLVKGMKSHKVID